MEMTLNYNGFCELTEDELYEVDGGLAVSLAIQAFGAIAFLLGVVATAFGQPVGSTLMIVGGVAEAIGLLLTPFI